MLKEEREKRMDNLKGTPPEERVLSIEKTTLGTAFGNK